MLIFAIATITTTTSCSKDEPGLQTSLMGEWETEVMHADSYQGNDWHDYKHYATFDKDGNCRMGYQIVDRGPEFPGWSFYTDYSWVATKSTLTLTKVDSDLKEVNNYQYSISKDKKALTLKLLSTSYFKGDKEIQNSDYPDAEEEVYYRK